MNNGVDGLNDAAGVGHNMEVDNVEDMNDVGNDVIIDEEVIARQKKLDKGKRTMTEDEIVTIKKIKNVCKGNGISIRENDNHISSNNESDNEDNVDEYVDMYSKSDNNESHKSFDYLSKGKYKVIELRKRKFEFKNTTDEVDSQERPTKAKQDTPNGVDKYTDVDDNGIGLKKSKERKEFTDKIQMNLQITIDAIVDLVMKKYKSIVSRTQCRNAKTFASDEGDATIQDHCGLHRSYAKALADSNEGNSIKVCVIVNPNEKTYFNRGLFWAASKALYAQLFNKIMEKIRRANPRAHENLVKKEPKTLSRAFSNEGMCCKAVKKICAAKSSIVAVPELNALRLKGNHNYVRVHRSHKHEEDEHHETVDGKMDC
nr:pentatricopeptide repeat-containing protein [Tanacetum cinerariifolium]